MYADFPYYTTEYKGNQIEEVDFERLAMRASEQVDFVTLGKAESYYTDNSEPIKKAVCGIAEILGETEKSNPLSSENQSNGGIVKSESAGRESYSYETFNSLSKEGQAVTQGRVNSTLKRYLLSTGLYCIGVPTHAK